MEDVTFSNEISHLDLMADIVAAYVSNNSVPLSELPGLIASTHAALAGLAGGSSAPVEAGATKATPAAIKKSITPDALISFVDGKPYKTLRRHLSTNGLDPDTYRDRFGLPRDYPMVTAAYSAQRSKLAKSLGLGQQRQKAAAKSAAVAETVTDKPKAARRSSKAPTTEAKVPKAARAKKSGSAAAAE